MHPQIQQDQRNGLLKRGGLRIRICVGSQKLSALSILKDEDDTTKIYAGFMYINVCVLDTSIDQMLADRKLSELVLHALTHIVPPPPEEDITVDSDYYNLELLLHESMDSAVLNGVGHVTL